MKNDEIVIAIALIFAVTVLILVKIIEFFVRFNNDTRYITSEMRCACDYKEYRYWRIELRCHYLCLIPFVNSKNVMRLYHRIYHKPKPENTEKRSDGLSHILAPSLIGICICAVCLCGATFAWFTSSKTSSIATVQSATYTVDISAVKSEISGNINIDVTKENNTYLIRLESGCEYEITVTAQGTAANGYCAVVFNEASRTASAPDNTTQYTEINPENSITLNIKANSSGILQITPQWGKFSPTLQRLNTESQIIFGTEQIVSEP